MRVAEPLGTLFFWALLPVAGLQGLGVRRTALRLPPPAGPGCGRSGGDAAGRPLRLRAIGDSIVAGVGVERWDQSLVAQLAEGLAERTGRAVRWTAEGRSGDAISHLLARIPRHPSDAPANVVVVSIGVNDVTGITPLRTWRRRVRDCAAGLRRGEPEALIVFAGIPQMERFPLPPQPLRACLGLRARRLDRILAAEAESRYGFAHVPTAIDPATDGFCADGFHPDAGSCARWGRELAARLAPLIRAEEPEGNERT